jgi:hypothetical protein
MATSGFGTTGVNPSTASVEQKLRAEQIVKNGASWFLAIAGLSILNSVLAMSGTGFHFIFGLGITEIVDVIGRQGGTTGSALSLVVNLFIAGVFYMFWHFARRGEKWAFLVGMALYAVDGLILVPFRDYWSVGFHAYALFRIFGGMQGLPVLEELRRRDLAANAPIVPQ